MLGSNIREEYAKAVRQGQKELKDRAAAGLDPYPSVLEELLPDISLCSVQDLSVLEIPADRIVGTRTAGRISAFSAGFLPLLDADSEFALKWMALCRAHLSDTGIRDPIECWEYLGDFYVQEGNKRVSVLRWFGAVTIPARVRRVLPRSLDTPRERAYGEFLEFYRASRIYGVQFRKPGEYAKLLAAMGKAPGEPWTDMERRAFSARFHSFKEALLSLNSPKAASSPEDALLLWLQVYSYDMLGELTPAELRKTLSELRGDVQTFTEAAPSVHTRPEEGKSSLLGRIIGTGARHLNAAFLYARDPETSSWTRGHALGAEEMERAMGEKVTVRSYMHADTPEETDALLEQAVLDGAEIVFTTAPPHLRSTLRAAVKHPSVRFLNCSTGTQLSSVRSYYCRAYEGKFITGVIAGAMADNNRVGYIGSYPILGVPASINAFALGVRMTNPRATVRLEWSCLPGDPVRSLKDKDVRVISNRDIPTNEMRYMRHGRYGTFLVDDDGALVPLASPCWMWGKLYEDIVDSVLSGGWTQNRSAPEAINYWWGMSSGAIEVAMTDRVPSGVKALAEALALQLRTGELDIFAREIFAQDGRRINDGTGTLDTRSLLEMDWLCDIVEGRIPAYDELLPVSRPLVRELGVFRDNIPPETGSEP